MYRTLACNFTTIGLRCFPAKFPKVSKKVFLQNIFGRLLLKLAIFGEWFEKEYVLKNTCHAPKNLKRRLPVVINKKPENQHNFQRVKQHAVNDRNIHHEESRLRIRRKIKRFIMFSDSIPKGIRISEFNRYITNATARLKCFPGATSKELKHYVVAKLQKESFNTGLIHIGINDILKDQNDLQCELFWKYQKGVKNMVPRRLLYRH